MYALHRSNYLRRSMVANQNRRSTITKANPVSHNQRIKDELRALGVSKYGLWKLESRYLPHIIHPSEHIKGVVYGTSEGSSVMLVATEGRVIFLDKKPLFIDEQEVTYDVVAGVSYSYVGLEATLTLHTRIKNFTIRTLNQKCAEGFVEYIEKRKLENQSMEADDDQLTKKWPI